MKNPEIGKWFETAKRREGQHKDESDATFVRVKADAPAWVIEAVRKAHQGVLPSDRVFAECEAAACAIDDCDEDALSGDDGEWITEHADGRVDVYTKVLFQWATDFCLTEIFGEAEERGADLFDARDVSIAKRLGVIQFCAVEMIVRTMLDAFNENRSEGEGDEGGGGDEDGDGAEVQS